jgi:copper chaperone CopZ
MVTDKNGGRTDYEEGAFVSIVAECLHALDGRLRIKVAAVKGAPQQAREIETQLQQLEGIDQVTANPTTGSVLILYNPRKIRQHEILKSFKTHGWPQEHRLAPPPVPESLPTQDGFGQELVRTVVRSTMEFALQRLVYTLI